MLIKALTLLLGLTVFGAPVQAGDLLPSERGSRELGWNWEPTEELRDIRVLPMLVVGPLPAMENVGFLGEELILGEQDLRVKRSKEIQLLPELLSVALPGEVARALPRDWSSHLRADDLSAGALQRLGSLLSRGSSAEPFMRRFARRSGGDAVLFQWMTELRAIPLCAVEAPRSMTEVAGRLVFVDDKSEPVLVEARFGMALVTQEGAIAFRYEDTYQTVLSGALPIERACREMARAFLDDIRPVLMAEAPHQSERNLR